MKRTLIGAAIAALVAVPAAIGLWGNASFSQAVPVRVPASGQILTPSPTPSPSSSGADDNGGDVPRDQRTEPGDDRDAGSGSDDDSHSGSGSDDSGSGSSGSGSGGDDGAGDDHGGHGSDD